MQDAYCYDEQMFKKRRGDAKYASVLGCRKYDFQEF